MLSKKPRYEEYFDEDFYNGSKTEGVARNIDGPTFFMQAVALAECIGAKKENGTSRTVLVTGCGMGFNVNHIKNVGFDVQGIDISSYAIEHSQAPDFVEQGDIRRLSKEVTGKFDVVTCERILEYMEEADVIKSLKEVKKVAKEFVVVGVVPEDHHDQEMVNRARPGRKSMRAKGWWESVFQKAGFKINQEKTQKYLSYKGWDGFWVLEA